MGVTETRDEIEALADVLTTFDLVNATLNIHHVDAERLVTMMARGDLDELKRERREESYADVAASSYLVGSVVYAGVTVTFFSDGLG